MTETLKDSIAEAMRECWYRGHTYGYDGPGMDLVGVEKWCDEQAAGVIRRASPPSPSETLVSRESGTHERAPGGGGVNEYRPWEAEGTTELKYWKRAYLTARREASEPTPEALEAWADELMDLVEELYSVEDWRNPEKGITQREACIDALRCEIARRLREATS